MGNEVIEKKVEQMQSLLRELEQWTSFDYATFDGDVKLVRSCERDLELLVELAAHVNAMLILQKQGKTPDSYRESFQLLCKSRRAGCNFVRQAH